MAGSIVISKDVRVSVSTGQFGYLIDRIGGRFDSSGMHVKAKVYLPMDEGGMTFVSAESLNPSELVIFLKTVVQAKNASQNEESFAMYEDLWNQLIEKLRQDARFIDFGGLDKLGHWC